jgi:1-deoxy-D-xylulose-5-phosphate synthase
METLEIGKAEWIEKGNTLAILAIGPLTVHAQRAIEKLKKEGMNPSLINMRFLKPLDTEMIDLVSKNHTHLLTIEDGTEMGGLYSAVSEYIAEKNSSIQLDHLSIPDHFVEHGDIASLYHDLGFDVESMVQRFKKYYGRD